MEHLDNLAHGELVKRRCYWEPEAFEAFWAAYPKKFGKVAAMRAWDRLHLPESEFPAIMAFVGAYRASAACGKYSGCQGNDEACGNHGACEYCLSRDEFKAAFVPADVFLLDQPWVL